MKHPLAETYLHLKWTQTKKFFFLNIFLYGLFTLFLTALSVFATYIVRECSDDKVDFPKGEKTTERKRELLSI